MSKPPHNQRGKNPQIPEPRQQQQQVVLTAQQLKQWSGPLPSPADLERFNQIIPNGADRIVKMAEIEQAHRIESDKVGLTATIRESRRGQYLGAAISGLAIVGAIFTAYIGAPSGVPHRPG